MTLETLEVEFHMREWARSGRSGLRAEESTQYMSLVCSLNLSISETSRTLT
jgi:hypothetical protein